MSASYRLSFRGRMDDTDGPDGGVRPKRKLPSPQRKPPSPKRKLPSPPTPDSSSWEIQCGLKATNNVSNACKRRPKPGGTATEEASCDQTLQNANSADTKPEDAPSVTTAQRRRRRRPRGRKARVIHKRIKAAKRDALKLAPKSMHHAELAAYKRVSSTLVDLSFSKHLHEMAVEREMMADITGNPLSQPRKPSQWSSDKDAQLKSAMLQLAQLRGCSAALGIRLDDLCFRSAYSPMPPGKTAVAVEDKDSTPE